MPTRKKEGIRERDAQRIANIWVAHAREVDEGVVGCRGGECRVSGGWM